MHLGLAIVLTGKGYKEHHWLVVPPSTTLVISYITHFYSMPSSFHTIPSTANHLGIGCAAIRICGQTRSCTNQGRAITPFMYNEEEYRVSPLYLLFHVF